MKATPASVLVIAILISGFIRISSASTIDAEESMLRHVVTIMSILENMNGRLPKTWSEIYESDSSLKAEAETIMKLYGWRMQDRYIFFNRTFPMFRNGSAFDVDEASTVIMGRVIPYKNANSEGKARRKFVYKNGRGELSSTDIPEEKAQKLFTAYEVTIQVPQGLPEFDENVRRVPPSPSGKMPDPDDARRIGPPKPKQTTAPPAASPANGSDSPSIANISESSNTNNSRLYILLVVAVAMLSAGIWLLFRFRIKNGNRRA